MLCVLITLVFPLLLISQEVAKKGSFSVSREGRSGLEIQFQLPQWSLDSKTGNGEELKEIKIADTPYLFIDDTETLPIFSTLISIPARGGVKVRITDEQGREQSGIKASFDNLLQCERAKGQYAAALYPESNFEVSEPQVLRDQRVVSLNVFPFQYDQSAKKLLIKDKLNISIEFTSDAAANELDAPAMDSPIFEKIYQSMILNYSPSRTASYASPRILVIYGNLNDSVYLAKVNEFVNWKRQKGFIVDAVSTAVTGTANTSIKTYIQNAYNNTATRPDYIVLIGDTTTGNMPVASNDTYMDYKYTLLAGTDNLGDALIGRISVETTEQLVNYMGKLMKLERDIDASNASWLNRMVLVGDTASSGISTIYTNQYISDVASQVNPSYTYTTQYNGSPSSTIINAAINQGVVFYNYRGYIGMSGWPSSIASLNNGNKLFHAVFITCNTGTFGGSTSTTETVVRQGTAAAGGGAITAIGMATSSTHTPMNNCLNVGIFHNLYPEGAREMGSAMLCGKLYLYSVYGVSHPQQAIDFSMYCNLMGDPTCTVYVGVPDLFDTTVPTTLPVGSPNLSLHVKNDAQQAVAGASVTFTNASGVQVRGFTDDHGDVLLNIPSTVNDSLMVTISKDDYKPQVSKIMIAATGGIVYDSAVIDDDTASGNGDGVINAGELINLYAALHNTGSSSISLAGVASCVDPYVTLIEYDRITYGAIAAGGYGENESPIQFSIAPDCPEGHQFTLQLALSAVGGSWTVYVPLTVRGAQLVMQSYTFEGSTGNVVNPGNSFPLTFTLNNSGIANLANVSGVLRSFDNYFVIQDSLGSFGSINAGATVTNGSNTFNIYARSGCVDGMTIPLELYLYTAEGYAQTISLSLTIGQTTVTDPLGQDAYGYFIFDQGDTGYTQHPSYQWVPIAPAEGGSGTLLNLTDPGNGADEGDQVGAVSITTVTLPFAFTFYGRSYTQASISSNGFISFGSSLDGDWRNWRLPGPGGPNPMLAVFWDDLDLVVGTSGVYTYYNSSLHYYVVEWYNMISGYNDTSHETFQAILYDPTYYGTQTNDGKIKLQYQTFNNVDLGDGDTYPHGGYCTIGIKDHTGTVGLEYTYNNTYPTAAATLGNNTSLFISTRELLSDEPHLVIQQVNLTDGNANNILEAGESASMSIQLRNSGLTGATSVNAVLSSTDPYVTINNANSAFNNIPSEGSATSLSNYTFTVSNTCPNEHQIVFTLTVTGSGNTWIYNFVQTVKTPVLSIGNLAIDDISGDNDNSLDPGETATITIPISNSGEVASLAGSATLQTDTTGITVVTGSLPFASIAAGATRNVVFTISAASTVTIGTLANMVFNATAGVITCSSTQYVEIGAPTEITIGTGTATQSYPLDRYYNYGAHEVIYLASEITTAGMIKSIGFYKASGSEVNPIDGVHIYMKHTTATSLTSGDYSLDGYTQVFNGSFPNATESGWMEVNLDSMYSYNGIQNLSILIVKDYQQWVSNYPMWSYSTSTATRARQERNDNAAPTTLAATNNLPNIKVKIFPNAGTLYPPQNLAATVAHHLVQLTWAAPVSGTPTSYRVFRNSTQIAQVSGFSYNDQAVVNNVSYNYYVVAVYASGTSDPCTSIAVTPIAQPATSFTAIPGNSIVRLQWAVPVLGTPTAYNVYRNDTLFTTESTLLFNDVDVVNGTTYSYYVKAVYSGEESAATNTIQVMPQNSSSSSVVIGTDTSITLSNYASPINITYKSSHGQSIYTMAELNAAGIYGPVSITQLGFYIATAPNLALPNFVVRLKHTTATDVSAWQNSTSLTTVYSATSYMPVAGDWDMLTLSTPFLWNGTDNILVDTAFGLVSAWSQTGTVQYSSLTNGYRYTWSDTIDQTNLFTGGSAVSRRPNIKFTTANTQGSASISLSATTLTFGNVQIGTTSTRNVTIQNTGNYLLAGYIEIPAGYTLVANGTRSSGNPERNPDANDLRFAIAEGGSQVFTLSLTPTVESNYNGTLVVHSNGTNNPVANITVTGAGYFPTLAAPTATVTHTGSNTVISWSAVPNAASYKVYRSSTPDGTYSLIGTTGLLQFTDSTLDKAFYYIKASSVAPAK